MTTKNKVHRSTTKMQPSAQYKVACFLCFRPLDKTGGIARYGAKRRTRDGQEIGIHYEICPVCADEIRNPASAEGILDGLVNYFTIRLRLQLEPLIDRIVEREENR